MNIVRSRVSEFNHQTKESKHDVRFSLAKSSIGSKTCIIKMYIGNHGMAQASVLLTGEDLNISDCYPESKCLEIMKTDPIIDTIRKVAEDIKDKYLPDDYDMSVNTFNMSHFYISISRPNRSILRFTIPYVPQYETEFTVIGHFRSMSNEPENKFITEFMGIHM